MSNYPEFARLINELVGRAPDLTNQLLAGRLNLHTEVIEHWRNGSRIPESNPQVRRLVECLHDCGVSLADDEVRGLYSASRLKMQPQDRLALGRLAGPATVDAAEIIETQAKLETLLEELMRKRDQPRVGQEQREEINSLIAAIDEARSRIPIQWNPRDLTMRLIPLSALENLARIEVEESILFTVIGISGGAAVSLLATSASGEPMAQGTWAVFWILLVVTVFLSVFLVLVRRHKRSIRQSYMDRPPLTHEE